ncbi:MAG: hypothetical protein IPM69_11945 [Ignavibacteria bacterium]|nr:hypothetical protein [Ignavibacteria bacterium]
MQIIHPINDFLYTIFPDVTKGDTTRLLKTIEDYFTIRTSIPKVRIEDDSVIIDVDTTHIKSNDTDYRRVVSLCDKMKYSQARPILEKLISSNPTNSEYHRVMGQVLSEQGNQVTSNTSPDRFTSLGS